MAASYRTSTAFGNNTGATLVGAFTAAIGDYLAVFATQKGNTLGPTVSDDLGGSWFSINNQAGGSGGTAVSGGWYVRNKFTTVAGTINVTATPNGAGVVAMEMVVHAVSGMRSTSIAGLGAGFPVRAWYGNNGTGGTTPTGTWTLTTKTTSMLLSAVCNTANPPGLTVPTGFTQRQNVGQAAPLGVQTATVDSGRADTTESWSNSTTAWFSSGIELDPLVSDANDMSSTIGTGGLGYNALAAPSVFPRSRGTPTTQLTYFDGVSVGLATQGPSSFGAGYQAGRNYGYDEGHDDGTRDTLYRSIAIGVSIVPTATDTPPVISVISSPVVSSDPLVLSIYDNKGISFYHVTCQDSTAGPRYTVWDPHDNKFSFPFDPNRCTVTGTGKVSDPYIFTIYRLGGWPTGISIDVRARAVGNYGNEADS